MLPGGLAFQVVGFAAGMFLDLKRPLLKWTHPQQAMKNNTNALGAMGGSRGRGRSSARSREALRHRGA